MNIFDKNVLKDLNSAFKDGDNSTYITVGMSNGAQIDFYRFLKGGINELYGCFYLFGMGFTGEKTHELYFNNLSDIIYVEIHC